MAYIEPQTKVWICTGVPLTPAYDDTLTFENKQQQTEYFMGKAQWVSTRFSVLKEKQGVLRMEGNVNKFYNCNYMIFLNENFTNKYFYAFITDVEYINPETTFVYFSLDVMQTWLFDFIIERSLVEREHVEDDTIFKHLEPEGIECNELLAFDVQTFDQYIGTKMMVIGTTVNPQEYEPGAVTRFYFAPDYDDWTISNIEAVKPSIRYEVKYNTLQQFFEVPIEVTEFKCKVSYENNVDLHVSILPYNLYFTRQGDTFISKKFSGNQPGVG